jgi:hypothetical protein
MTRAGEHGTLPGRGKRAKLPIKDAVMTAATATCTTKHYKHSAAYRREESCVKTLILVSFGVLFGPSQSKSIQNFGSISLTNEHH